MRDNTTISLGRSAVSNITEITSSLECMRGYLNREGHLPNVDFPQLVQILYMMRSGVEYALGILEELGVQT